MMSQLTTALADRYGIERELGAGGMAIVYLAQDLKHKRNVAVKVLRPELSAIVGATRFLTEIQVTASLQHPNILPLYDSGEADSLLYYVMPYIEGESLRDKLRREMQLAIGEAVKLAESVAAALQYAHDRGVVHRDIKPENILLHSGQALVADFGIALALSQAGDDRITKTGLSVGTPHYMSPEQASGARSIDGRSDCYALACVLYEMLGGDPPFVASTAQAIIARHLADVAPPITTVRPDTDANIAAALAKALSKAPADRFDSVAAFAAALKRSEPTPSRAQGAREKSIAVLPFANMSVDPDNELFTDGITEEIINALTHVPGLHVASRTSCFYFKGKSPVLAEVVAKLRVSHVLEGSVRRAGNRLRITVQLIDVGKDEHLWSERYDRTMDDVFAVQDDIATTVAERMRASLGPASGARPAQPAPSNVRAYELYLKGRGYLYQRGLGLVKGVQCMQEALELDPDYPAALAGLADANTLLGLFGAGPPGQYRRTALTAAQRAVSLAPDLAEAHNAVAGAQLLFEWNRPLAEASFRRALELNPQYLQARAWYAIFYLCLMGGRFEEAIEQTARCIESDPLSGYAHTVHAFTLGVGGRPFDAFPFLDEARSLGADVFLSHFAGQMCHYTAGQLDESIAVAETALAVSGRHPWSLANLCVSLVAAGRETEARAVLGELTSRAGVSYVQPFVLAQTAAAVGEADAAFAYAAQAFEEHDPLLPSFGPYWKATHHLRSDPRFMDLLQRAEVFPGVQPGQPGG